MQLSPSQVEQARRRIAPYLQPTRLMHSQALSCWLKLETLQPTGSFKVRPAFNGMLARLEEVRARGALASSSGNFAQAVAYAARELGVDAQIVMPSNTSPFKIERTKALGGTVVLSGPSFDERWALTERLERETGRVLLHPYDSVDTIAGDATIGSELLEQLPDSFQVLVPASGGGMLAGIASVIKQARPDCRVVGVQSAANGSLLRSFQSGARVRVGPFTSIADALVASIPGENTFALIKKYVDEVVVVSEGEIKAAMAALFAEHKFVVEPGGAVTVAALMSGRTVAYNGPRICILSGGNIQPEVFTQLISD